MSEMLCVLHFQGCRENGLGDLTEYHRSCLKETGRQVGKT